MNRKLLLIPVVFLATALVVVSVDRSQKLKERSDYNVYYLAGQHFFHGDDLYSRDQYNRNFYYPPFAAFLFQALTTVPMRISANIFFLLNILVLFPLSVWLIFSILRNLGYDQAKIRVPLILATVASLKFIWNNLTMFQMNLVIFTLILTGLWFMSRKKDIRAAVVFTLAAFIKVLPVFFVLYLVLLRRTRGVILAVAITGAACTLVPSLQRGLSQGVTDHVRYYQTFLRDFREGRVITSGVNHTLKSAMLKAFVPEARNQDVYPSQYPGFFRAGSLALLAMFALLITVLIAEAKKTDHGFGLEGIAMLFIFIHLFSGITWTAHLVDAMFFYLPLFFADYRKMNLPVKIFYILLIVVVFLLAIEGSDTTGKTIYHFIRTFDLFVVVMVGLFGYYGYRVLGKRKNEEERG